MVVMVLCYAKSESSKVGRIIRGSGNVFADLGLANPEERLLKARLASLIYDSIEAKGWTQAHTAGVLGITQPDVSDITRGRLKNFSSERLLNLLTRLNHRITITVSSEGDDLPKAEIVIPAQGLPEERLVR